jgi:hypothetical protein
MPGSRVHSRYQRSIADVAFGGKNFAQTLEKFFGHRRRLLKKVAQRLAGKALPSSKAAVPRQVENEQYIQIHHWREHGQKSSSGNT